MVLRKTESAAVPVLYSAIGSLEDPSNQSLGRWRQEHMSRQARRKNQFTASHLNQSPIIDGPVLPQVRQDSLSGTKSDQQSIGLRLQSNPPVKLCENRSNTVSSEEQQLYSISQQPLSESKESTFDGATLISSNSKNSIIATKSIPNTVASTRLRSNLRKGRDQPFQDPGTSVILPEKTLRIKENENGDRSRGDIGGGGKKKNVRVPIEMFRLSSDAYTPRMGKKSIEYKPAEMRTPVQQMASPLGTLSRPNFRDALRRVAMIIRQHVIKIEKRFAGVDNDEKGNEVGLCKATPKPLAHRPLMAPPTRRTDNKDGLFSHAMRDAFSEDHFITPTYKCTMVRVPMARPGMVCGMKQIRRPVNIPTESEIYEFAHQLFKKVQLSSECSIVCLIYVERLMETAHVPLLAITWRPIFMCGLLLASKVWQDLSSWNIEFATVYPQYSLEAINRLELLFLRMIRWDLYISSSLYAKYYFALRSLVEKPDFRQRYNQLVGGVNNVHASEALKIEKRSTMVKEEALLHLSRSM